MLIANQFYIFAGCIVIIIGAIFTVINLITNAINHVSMGKTITVTGEKKGNKIKISVYNTGNNIPEEELNKIWEVCYKVDKARARKYGGHGIGLSLVRLIMQLHGGIAKVENVEYGVNFSLEIPESCF